MSLPRRKCLKKEQADTIRQLVFDFGVPDDLLAELDNALYKLTAESGERWLFVKISPEQFRYVTQTIRQHRTTLLVWNAAITYMRMDTGEILATRDQLAEDADIFPSHVSAAMTELAKIGAIIKRRRGTRVAYFINPNVGWNGNEGMRQVAVKEAPALCLVSDRPGD